MSGVSVEINPTLLHRHVDWDAAIARLEASHEDALTTLRRARDGNLIQVTAAWRIFMAHPELLFGAPRTDDEKEGK
ncbi:MAG: hypothetical protein F4Y03_00480 [Alphaproteobacteria bacterium]|nr:hypothetical protein [Alphaproteobacteria bacterium]